MITPNWLTSHLPDAERLVDSMMIGDVPTYEWIETLLKQLDKGKGRPRQLKVRTLFIALQLMAMDGEFFLDDVPTLLDVLSERNRTRLGLPRVGTTTTKRKVYYLYGRIDAALRRAFTEENRDNDERYRDFDLVFQAMATVGAHPINLTTASISIDGSDVRTWGKKHKVWRTVLERSPDGTMVPVVVDGVVQREKVEVMSDPDARVRGGKDVDGKGYLVGYSLTTACSVREEDGPDVPRTTLAARFRPITFHDRQMALACVGEVAERRGKLGDVLVDRGYTSSLDGKDFLIPVRAMGGEPIFDLTVHQVGPRPQVNGAVMIDGRPYSPSLPKHLYKIEPPRAKGTDTYKLNPMLLPPYQQQIAERELWALVPQGRRKPNGKQTFICPAAAGKLACPLRQSFRTSTQTLIPVLNAPKNPQLGSVCTQRFPAFTIDELPLYQRHVYGSKKWKDSYDRRGYSVEQYFGAVKDPAASNLRWGNYRVMGIIKIGLLVAFVSAATNQRLARAFDRRKPVAKVRPRRTGRPRKDTLIDYRQKVLDATDSKTVILKV